MSKYYKTTSGYEIGLVDNNKMIIYRQGIGYIDPELECVFTHLIRDDDPTKTLCGVTHGSTTNWDDPYSKSTIRDVENDEDERLCKTCLKYALSKGILMECTEEHYLSMNKDSWEAVLVYREKVSEAQAEVDMANISLKRAEKDLYIADKRFKKRIDRTPFKQTITAEIL